MLVFILSYNVISYLFEAFHFYTRISYPLKKVRLEIWKSRQMSIGLDWVRTMTNFVGFGLDPDCKLLDKVRIRTEIGLS